MTTRDALRLLQAEIVQVVGCTEPAAIAYALRTLVRHTQPPPSPETFRAELRISVDARRNASTAVVPRLKQPGIHAAAAAGLASRADDFITRQVPAEKGYSLETQIARRVTGRMTGYTHPVMTITGSGNQGIFIGLPYQRLHARHGDRILPAVVFSLLAQIHLSARHQRLSSTCGLATKAAPALAAGLAYARGATPAEIERLFRAIPARLKALTCEGAEPACGDKARRAYRAVAALNLGLP